MSSSAVRAVMMGPTKTNTLRSIQSDDVKNNIRWFGSPHSRSCGLRRYQDASIEAGADNDAISY